MTLTDDRSRTRGMGATRHIFMVGIGGAGMSGIAEVLIGLGYAVSGSDESDSKTLDRLRSLGAQVHVGHGAEHISDVDVLVVSAAVPLNNPERLAARAQRIPVIPRAEMLAELMRYRFGIAVAGTHGKTTTTSLIASILDEAGEDPTFVIGGLLNQAGANAALGEGQYLVVEADESDASFLHLQPMMSLVTNIEADHMEHYEGDAGRYAQAFNGFLQNLPFYGFAVMCLDDRGVRDLLPELTRKVVTYGQHSDADYRLENYRAEGLTCHFDLVCRRMETTLALRVGMPGFHNAQNAAGAAALCLELGLDASAIQQGLAKFAGVGRRFSDLGNVSWPGGCARLIDDYGHHPTEVAVTLKAAREAFPGQRVVMVYQPHRFTRTRDHFDDFVSVLGESPILVLLEVYAAGETPIPGANAHALALAIRERGGVEPKVVSDPQELAGVLMDVLQDRDILLMQGAGDIGRLSASLADAGSIEVWH
ncbi:MAG: UDP-N-acetylmuramate--L-alanine ligase [Halieaceae bacterium]